MQLANPQYLWLFLVFIPLIVWYLLKQRNARPTLAISSIGAFAKAPMPWRARFRHILFILRLCALGCLIIILCRPQLKDSWRTSSTEGTDIILAMDISSSMLARDFKPNRLNAAKDIAKKFVTGRPDDNIGVVIFSGESLTGLPMTSDHAALVNYLESINLGMLEDGTAIGDGIATSINRLKEGKAKSKSIILMTDGSNNTGIITPLDAADRAKANNIKVYTIGIGTEGTAEVPVAYDALGRIQYERQKVVIDEVTLKKIAQETNGKYFRATNNKVLADVFKEIDQLEKTKMDVKNFSHTEDDYAMWGWILLALVGLELVLRYTVFRTMP
jgi:Ca-activated chloride channel family protein